LIHRRLITTAWFRPLNVSRDCACRDAIEREASVCQISRIIRRVHQYAVVIDRIDGLDLAYFTGQRNSDIRKMKWTDIAGDEIHVIQDKTGAEVWVPLHPDLQAELAVTERRGKTIIAAKRLKSDGQTNPTAGNPLSKAALHLYWQDQRRAWGLIGGSHENTLHGLRKNATINLLEAGCTNSEAKAITGHSTDQMVNHYAKKVNQRGQAREAMNKIVQFDKAATENG